MGYYKGIWCQSTYELAYVIYNLDHGISFTRNTERFKYLTAENKSSEYLPDFVEGDTLIEIKGYYTPTVDLKLKSVTKPIKILYREDMEYMFDYIGKTYDKPLIELF